MFLIKDQHLLSNAVKFTPMLPKKGSKKGGNLYG
jgi:hypothetical protein